MALQRWADDVVTGPQKPLIKSLFKILKRSSIPGHPLMASKPVPGVEPVAVHENRRMSRYGPKTKMVYEYTEKALIERQRLEITSLSKLLGVKATRGITKRGGKRRWSEAMLILLVVLIDAYLTIGVDGERGDSKEDAYPWLARRPKGRSNPLPACGALTLRRKYMQAQSNARVIAAAAKILRG